MNFKIRGPDFFDQIEQANRVILEMELFGKPFFHEPLRTSKNEILGNSGVKKMLEQDNYRLDLIRNENPVILDVGSHIGIFPRVIKKQIPKAQIHSIEPDPDNFQLLKLNNEIIENTFSHRFGIFSNNSSQTLKGSNYNSWRSTLDVNSNFFREDLVGTDPFTFGEYKVECVTLDNFAKRYEIINVDLIGITVPGEIGISILNGAKELLTSRNPIVSIVLYSNEVKIVKKYMNSIGYSTLDKPRGMMHTFVRKKV
jgi:FkbM family methyltransferase